MSAPGRMRLGCGRVLAGAACLLVLWFSDDAHGAPPIRYGGTAQVTVWGASLPFEPADQSGWGHQQVFALAYERLYRCPPDGTLEPVLAGGPPELSERTLRVPLRPGIRRHDGGVLSAADVAGALSQLRTGRRRGAYVLTPVQSQPGAIRAEPGAVLLELRAAYPEATRLLCAPHARIAVRTGGPSGGRDKPPAGTGPFRLGGTTGRTTTFLPFVHHRQGRPYLDRVVVRALTRKADAARATRRNDALILFGAPDLGAPPANARSGARFGEELVLLVLGRGLPRAVLAPRLGAALDAQRSRLARKWRSVEAQAARCLVTEDCPASAAGNLRRAEPRRVPLLVDRHARWRPSFTSRVQVALAPLGLMAPIRTMKPVDLARPEARPAISAWLTSVVLPAARDRFDRLHALFALAAALGRPDVLAEADWVPVVEGHRTVRDVERRVVERMGLIPLVRVPLLDVVRSELVDLVRATDGALRLDNARLHAHGRP